MIPVQLLSIATAPAWERYLWVGELEPGAIHRTSRVTVRPGGKGVHVALAGSRLDLRTKVLGIADGGTGQAFRAALAVDGIDARFVAGEALTRTCTCIVDESTRLVTEIDEPATAVTTGEWSDLVATATTALHGARVLAISGSLPASVSPERVASLIQAAAVAGALSVLDTSGPALRHGLAARPDWVKVNEHEAREVLGASLAVVDLELARGLQALGGRNAVVTLGERGCAAALEGGEVIRVVGQPVVRGAAVGSGDCFLAGLAAGLIEACAPQEALTLATAAAGLNAGSVLVAEFTRADVARAQRAVTVLS